MKPRFYLFLGILLVAALGWVIWPTFRPLPAEPVYDGKRLSYWLSTGAPDASVPPLSLFSDPNAVPFLIDATKQDSWFGATIYRKQVWPKLPGPIQKRLPPPSAANPADIRGYAVVILKNMGPIARPAIPALIRALKQDDSGSVRSDAALSLWELRNTNGDNTVTAALMRALRRDEDALVRSGAAGFLGDSVGEGNKAAIAALTEALKDKDRSVQIEAASALARVGKGDSNVVAALGEALNDKNRDVQIHAALALWNLGELKRDTNVVTALTQALKHNHTAVRREATNALRKLDPEAAAKAGVEMPLR